MFQNLLKDEAALKIQLFSSASSYNSFSFFISKIHFPDNKFPIKLAPETPKTFCSFVSFLVVLVTPLSIILESPRA